MDLNGLLATSLETPREEDVMMKSRKEEEDGEASRAASHLQSHLRWKKNRRQVSSSLNSLCWLCGTHRETVQQVYPPIPQPNLWNVVHYLGENWMKVPRRDNSQMSTMVDSSIQPYLLEPQHEQKSPVNKASAGRSTYNHLSSWLTDARNLTNPNTVIILIGNKADLEAQRDVTYEEAKQFAEENGLLFLEASAKTGENVEEAFLEAAKKIYQNIQDGSLDLNAAESGVQHKPSAPQGGRLNADSQPAKEGCSC
ncbi:hypothetical protein CCH79_00016198 [Gambusia affinis]|uniref:Small monomeric GTPase n=1 Tax=Gambusia affinis TaxID=33528 RepID=A0A315VL20_GAMAF|nr:hypothetical protein CCH79_00016198 [Gambusia affinis]